MNDIPLRDVPVMVVSNNEYEQSVIRQFLRQLRVGSVTMVENGVDALHCLREELEQIIICRYASNFTDSYRLYRFMNEQPRFFTHVRCRIIYSHDNSKQTIARLAELKVDGFMLWPLSFNAFSKVIERPFLQERPTGQEGKNDQQGSGDQERTKTPPPATGKDALEEGKTADECIFL